MVLRLILSWLFDDGFCPAEVGVCRCDVLQALVIALVIEVFDAANPLKRGATGNLKFLETRAGRCWRSGSPPYCLPDVFGFVLTTPIKPMFFGQCGNPTVRMCSIAFP